MARSSVMSLLGLCLLVLALGQHGSVNAENIKAWSLLSSRTASGGQRVLQAEEEGANNETAVYVRLNHKGLVAALTKDVDARRGGNGGEERVPITFELPGVGEIECLLGPSNVFHPDLAAKYPNLLLKSGLCSDNRVVSLNLLTDSDRLGATFTEPDSEDFVLVDKEENDETGLYKISNSRHSRRRNRKQQPFTCSSRHPPEHASRRLAVESKSTHLRRDLQTTIVGRQLRFAVAINRQLSISWGSTTAAILQRLANNMNRLNGMFLRELGVYFQVIANNDKLICSDEYIEAKGSCSLPNTASGMLNSVENWAVSQGILQSQFDLVHGLGAWAGGVAWLGTVCWNGYKNGASGFMYATDATFTYEIFGHEVGHNLGADHTMRDCTPDAGYGDSVGHAVEPGSGTTVMSYAGTCDNGKNVATYVDHYFHSVSLQKMRQTLNNSPSCGTSITVSPARTVPQVETPADGASCTLPVNQRFVLRGSATACGADCKYQWDEANSYLQNYLDSSQPRFRSWLPTPTPMRYFPNLVFLSSTTGSRPTPFEEILPASAKTLKFRFIAKTTHLTGAQSTFADTAALGSFAHRDLSVTFNQNLQALKFTAATVTDLSNNGLISGTSRTISWVSSGTSSWSPTVEILLAVNPLVSVSKTSFKYDNAPVDLNWISAGTYPNTGSASVTIPTVSGATNAVAVMIWTQEQSQACRAFDFVSKVTFSNGGATPTVPPTSPTLATKAPTGPTKAPTSPTSSPTLPTKAPTGPTKAPTSPTKAPTIPTRAPTGPTKAPTSPTKATVSPTSFPTRPTRAPTVPTRVPTRPTRSPTRNPTPPTTIPPKILASCKSGKISKKQCNNRKKLCSGHDIKMKWQGVTCKIKRKKVKEAGCYCAGHCAYQCPGSCKKDPECFWRDGQCFIAETGQLGWKLNSCALERV